MIAALEEDPSFVPEEVFRDGNDTRFGVGGRFKDFVGNVSIRYKNNKPNIVSMSYISSERGSDNELTCGRPTRSLEGHLPTATSRSRIWDAVLVGKDP